MPSVAIDGSKFKAVNARDKNFTEAKMKRRLERIEESVARQGWARSVVSKDDVRLEVFQKGKGSVVLMHPSLGRPAQDFEDLGNRVAAAGYHVVLINPRGIAGSTGPMDRVTLLDLGADVWMVADSLKIDRAFVLGQNFGNRVARATSSLQPDESSA